jgi:hypothetical protein
MPPSWPACDGTPAPCFSGAILDAAESPAVYCGQATLLVICMPSLMRRALLAATAIAFTAPAFAQVPVDDLRVRQLEQEVQRLQREVDAQARRLQVLEQGARVVAPVHPAAPVSTPENSSPAWLISTTWDRIKPGMKATDVIAVLGRPTSARYSEDGRIRTLFYAMEIGATALLAGNIRVDDTGVVEINRPVLK